MIVPYITIFFNACITQGVKKKKKKRGFKCTAWSAYIQSGRQ